MEFILGHRSHRSHAGEVTRVALLGMGWFPDQAGGLNRYLRELRDALDAQGIAAHPVVLGPARDAPAGSTVVSDNSSPLLRRLTGLYVAARRMESEVDLVDSHFALYGAGPVLFGAFRRKPLVVHFQGPWADESANAGRQRRGAVATKRRIERAVYRRADAIIVLSAAFKRILVDSYGIAPWHITVVPPGVDLERFKLGSRNEARRELGLPDDAWVGVTVRRLVPRMGLDVLIEAWASFTSSWEEPALLVVAGGGPNRRALEEQAAAAGIADKVRFLGRVSDADLVSCYQAADVCIVPSTALEGFGLVVLESAACGTPVIVSDAGGLPETVATLDLSLVVESGDPDALSRRLSSAADGSAALPDGDRCRSHAEAHSWSRVADRTIAIYESALAPKPQRRPRVVYIDHCAQLSGGELALVQLLTSLSDVDAHVILGENGPLEGLLLRQGISVEVLAMARSARHLPRDKIRPGHLPIASLMHSLVYVARLVRRLRQLHPDLVHTNSLKAALVGGVAARIARIPLVIHVLDRMASDYLPSSAQRLVRMAARSLPNAVVANSRATLETLELPPDRLAQVIYPAVALESSDVTWVEGDSDKPLRIGILGRLAPWKGQHHFLLGFAEAFGSGTEEAVIVGSPMFGEDPYEAELRALVKELHIEARVEFRGFRQDVAAELSRLDILVHASVIPEPFGRVIIEGMAMGLPVVAPACGGPLEVIDDESDGLLYPHGDVTAMAAALRRLAGDPDLRNRLAAAGRLKARRFRPEHIAAEMQELYGSVLGTNR